MSPLDAVRHEINAELEAYARRLGDGPMPGELIVRVEFDQKTGMPRAVEIDEHRRRHILGGQIDQRKRIA